MNGAYCVYKHTTPCGKVYIGITRRDPNVRWRKNGTGYQSSPHFYAAIKKYGWDAIKHEIIQTGLSRLEAGEIEKALIAQYNSTDRRYGYNQTYGGEYGIKITPEIREKIRERNKQYYSRPEIKAALRERSTGYKHTDDAKKKMSEHHKGLTHVATDEWKANISLSLKKHYQDEENRKKHEPDFKRIAGYGVKKSIAIEQIDCDGNVIHRYKSMKEAFRETGIRDGNISKCCNGKTHTAGGYYWRIAR